MTGVKLDARSLGLLGALGLGLAIAGCAHVGEEDLTAELDQLREEMRQADQENADRIDGVEQRVNDVEGRIDGLESDLRSLEDDFNTTVERLESALRFSTPVHFAFDEAEIDSESHDFLDRFASVVQEYYSTATITVEGFTDPAGNAEYNRQLGQQRAEAVRTYLIENTNLAEENIRAVSYGEDTDRLVEPGAFGPGEEGRPNRRAVLVVDFNPDESGPIT